MVLPRCEVLDPAKIAKSPDSEKNTKIHNYFVFEKRKWDREHEAPTINSETTPRKVMSDSPFEQHVSFYFSVLKFVSEVGFFANKFFTAISVLLCFVIH